MQDQHLFQSIGNAPGFMCISQNITWDKTERGESWGGGGGGGGGGGMHYGLAGSGLRL